jgi:hypothetical protein
MLMLRSTHDALLAAERERTADALAAYRAEVARHDAALAELRALSAALAPKPAPTLPDRTPDPVTQAIAAASKGSSALRSHLAFTARRMRDEGQDEADIVRQITDWSYRPGTSNDPDRAADRAEAEATVAAAILG